MVLSSRKDFISTLTPPQCPICYENVNAPITTSCQHTFCLECAKTWLKTSATCPSCRAVLYDADAEDDEEPEDESEAEMLADPEYVQQAFASSIAADAAEPVAESDAPSANSLRAFASAQLPEPSPSASSSHRASRSGP